MVAHKIKVILSSLLVAGCTWNALYSKPTIAPVHVAFADIEKPHPGKYLLLVSSAGLDQNVMVGGKVCTSHDFPLQVAHSFDQSVEKTLANLVEKIEVVSAPMTKKQIKAAKARALITIKAEDLSASLLVSPGFLTKQSEAKVQISARVQILKTRGALFDEQLSATESSSISIGRCLDAHKPVSAALSKAFNQLVEQIGKSVSQSLSAKK